MKIQRGPHDHGFGAHMPKARWVRAASAGVLLLVEEELAAPRVELEHRLYAHGHAGLRFDPHIITEALGQLVDLGAVRQVQHTTKGLGPPVELYTVADTRLRTTALNQAIRRKAMLYARFLRLAQTAGAAGELVIRNSLQDAGAHLAPMTPGFGEVARYGGMKFPGALDSGAFLQFPEPSGLPGRPADVLIEVKNRRLVLYPQHKEPHQLLHKAALAQVAQPDRSVLPVLLCRRGHYRLFVMARDLGFLVHETHREYVTVFRASARPLAEQVRTELHLDDLDIIDPEKPPRIVNFFQKTIPGRAPHQLPRWKIAAPLVLEFVADLRKETSQLTPQIRSDRVRRLRQAAEEAYAAADMDFDGSWSLPDREDVQPAAAQDPYEEEPDFDLEADEWLIEDRDW